MGNSWEVVISIIDQKEIQNKQPTTDFIVVVCLIVDRFRSTKTFFKTKNIFTKFPEVIKNG